MSACEKKDTAAQVDDPSFIEGFDKLSEAVSRGWTIKNNTRPLQGNGRVLGTGFGSEGVEN